MWPLNFKQSSRLLVQVEEEGSPQVFYLDVSGLPRWRTGLKEKIYLFGQYKFIKVFILCGFVASILHQHWWVM